jgi:hypothetical protein
MNRQLQYAPAQAPLQAAREDAPVAGELTPVRSVMARGSRARRRARGSSAATTGDEVVKMLVLCALCMAQARLVPSTVASAEQG